MGVSRCAVSSVSRTPTRRQASPDLYHQRHGVHLAQVRQTADCPLSLPLHHGTRHKTHGTPVDEAPRPVLPKGSCGAQEKDRVHGGSCTAASVHGVRLNCCAQFGDVFLVAPVVKPGATSRTLYLPSTTEQWIDVSSRAVYDSTDGRWRLGYSAPVSGNRTVSVSAPLETCPFFVQAGSVVATLDPSVDTLNHWVRKASLLGRYSTHCPSYRALRSTI